MAFNINAYSRISGSANNDIITLADGTAAGAPCIYSYISLQDDIATISAADYFNPLASVLNLGDLFYIVGTDANNFFTVVSLSVQPPHVTVATGVVTGDVVGPASSVNNDIAVFNGTTGKIIKDGGVTIAAIQNGSIIYQASATGNDSYVVTLTPAPTALVNGFVVNFKTDVANTGGATLNVNGLGAVAIQKAGVALITGDLAANQIYSVVYNSTGPVWQLQSTSASSTSGPSSSTDGDVVLFNGTTGKILKDSNYAGANLPYAVLQNGAVIYSADTGAANAYVVTLSPVPAAYTTGMVINFKAANANTGASTVNVNGLGTKNITKEGATALAANDIVVGQLVTIIYDGTEFQITSNSGNFVNAPAALTEVSDTNVTLTLGGTPATALLQAVSITAGWSGTLAETRGGTHQSTYVLGDTLYASAANTLSKLAGNTTSGIQYLSQTGTGVVSAAPIWATISGGDITGAALTEVSDTNVTLTLGGTPATALLRAASITAGWTGLLATTRGGTGLGSYNQGDMLYASAANTLSALAKSTSGVQYINNQGTTNDPQWATISGGDITGAALTEVNDTNVTLTLGGTPATALLRAASITAGWTGQLALTRGGTNASLTASNGGLVYSTASAMAILAGTATANQIPLSGSNAAPSWSTATYPATTTANQLMYSSATNVVGGLATANSGTLVTSSSGVPSIVAMAADGDLLIGSSAGAPAVGNISGGTGAQVVNGHNTITISSTGTTINTQTASYGLVLADAGKIVEMNVGSANNLTVPLNATQAFAIGTIIDIVQFGAGKTTVVATGGVTIESQGGNLSLGGQYAGATLYKRGTDDWVLVGNLIA